jgi:hypothetical protein
MATPNLQNSVQVYVVAHHAVAAMTDIPGADIVAPQDEDIGLLL